MSLNSLKNSKLIAFACIILVVLLLNACGSSGDSPAPPKPPPPPPQPAFVYSPPADKSDGWATADAADVGVSVPLLEEMMNSMDVEFDIVDSIAISYRGELIFDETIRTATNEFDDWVGNMNPAMHVLFSVTKGIAAIGVGIAIEQGIFSGLDQPYLELFPYESYQAWDERKDDILLEDVLTMRLGLQWNEWDPPYTSPDNAMLTFYENEVDFSKALLDLPLSDDPGTVFAYSTPAVVSIGQAIENNNPLTLIDWGLANLLGPLDISDVEIFTTPTGLPDLGRGLYLVTRDLLKFGQLYANGGSWNGRQIVAESWVDVSTQTHVPITWSDPDKFDWKVTGMGYYWWTGYFEHDGQQIATYAARGHGEQLLMVIPGLELVIAVNSHAWNLEEDEVNQVFSMISRFVIPALQ